MKKVVFVAFSDLLPSQLLLIDAEVDGSALDFTESASKEPGVRGVLKPRLNFFKVLCFPAH
jgi:hypothetical protein